MEKKESLTEVDSLFRASSDQKEESKINKCKGILVSFAWVPLTVVSTTSVQLLERQIPDFELNALRFGTAGLLFAIGLIFVKRQFPFIPKIEISSVSGFGALTFCSVVSLYTAVTFISLTSVQSVCLSTFIITGIILYATFLNEQITLKMVFAAVLCCSGVLLVIQPQFVFQNSRRKTVEEMGNISEEILTSNGTNTSETDMEELMHAVDPNGILGILGFGLSSVSGLCTSLNILLIKKRSFLNEHMLETLFWSYGICTVLSLITMAIFEKPTFPEFGINYLYVGLHCGTYVLHWPTYMYAARYISGTTISMIVTSAVVFMLIPQYTVLSTIFPGNRNWIEVVGVIFVLLGCSLKSLSELRKEEVKE